MALTKVSRGLLSTGIVDNSNATAITLNADESATFSGGVDVTGTATMGGLTVDGNDSYTSNIKFDYGASAPTYFSNWGYKSSSEGNKVFLTITDGGAAKDVLVANYNGNVGIGTSSPSTKLHLGGTAPGDSIIRQDSTVSGTNWEIGEREAGKWQIFEDDSDSVVATFTSTGNVGIGVSSPQRTLVLGKGDSTGVQTQYTNSTTGAALGDGFTVGIDGSENAEFWNFENTNMLFATNGSERMRITSAGGIEIPNQNAINELTFTGTEFTNVLSASISGFQLGTTGAGYLSFITNNQERLQITLGGAIYANQQYIGGFGAISTSGTASFDHSSNARAGNAYTLLQGTATGGPGGTAYYHVFNYEYGSKNGTSNMTQLAYGYNDTKAYMRWRYSGTWGSWVALH